MKMSGALKEDAVIDVAKIKVKSREREAGNSR